MRALLDTHTLIWTMDDTARLSPAAEAVVTDPDVDSLSLPFRAWMTRVFADLDFERVPIELHVTDVRSDLPRHHGDPLDRLLVATALVERLPVVSADPKLDPYPVTRLW